MDLGLKGKTAIVTGASKGIGFASALVLATRSGDRLEAAADELRRHFATEVVTVSADLSRLSSAERVAEAAISAANAGLLAVTKVLADEVAEEDIVVLAVSPGPVRTDRWHARMSEIAQSTGRAVADIEAGFSEMVPIKRFGEPEEIAQWIAFLASERASNLTDTSVTPDGGATRSLA
jgi:NAD(P)-dependent dehydrogenase (short-subunit alcohol dehydrogenase family)